MKTVSDLWPGDILYTREPGHIHAQHHKIVNIDNWTGFAGKTYAKLTLSNGEREFTLVLDWDNELILGQDPTGYACRDDRHLF